jgi:hypothetical protein
VRYHLCDTEQGVTGISIELAIEGEPFAESVPYELTLHAAGAAVAHVPQAALTPAELFALGHALLDAAADGFGHFVPFDEVFGLDLSPPSVPRAIDEVSIAAWVDAGRARAISATRSGVGVQMIVDTRALATVAEAVCDEAARVLAA